MDPLKESRTVLYSSQLAADKMKGKVVLKIRLELCQGPYKKTDVIVQKFAQITRKPVWKLAW